MRWLIFALGIALTLGGAASIVSGLPYIRIESGWTEVIAGTTALSAGIVTVGLGAVLGALRRLESRLSADRPTAAVVPVATLEAADPVLPVAVEPAGVRGEAASYEPDLPFPSAATLDTSAKTASRPLMGRMRSRLTTMGTPENERPDSSGLVQPGVDPSGPAARPSPRPRVAASTWEEAHDLLPSTRPSGAVEAGSASLQAPTVVGRYESGGASYVLFSDGTIEVETEAGTHRFASMEELKTYIGQQDGSVGG